MRKLSSWSTALVLAGLPLAALAALPNPAAPLEQCDTPLGVAIAGYTAAGEKRAEATATEMAKLHRWLVAEAAPLTKRAPLSVALSREERASIGDLSDCVDCTPIESSERRKLVGLSKSVNFEVDLARSDATKAYGLGRASDGGLVWTQAIHSKGAMAMRVEFSGLNLPLGAELYVYNAAGEAHGPYTGRGMRNSGELVSHSVTGDTAFVQLRTWGRPSVGDLAQLQFSISEIGHIGPEFELARRMNRAMAGNKEGECSYNATCVVNGECSNSWSHMDNVRKAIAHMLFKSGGGYYICSGGLLNNSRNDGTPLFLTANHCISRDREASSLETFFDFRADGCGDTSWCNASYDTLRDSLTTTLGASLLARGTAGDYSLMQLSTNPAGRHYMGWSTTAVANSNGTDLFRISHPGGAPQSWSTHDVNANGFSCGTLPRGTFIYSNDSAGATEGGSSGSPVLNSNGQVVGQLYGACGSDLNDNCNSVDNLTVDGALAAYYPNVAAWLDPSGGGGPGEDTVASVASVSVSVVVKGPWRTFTATVAVVDQNGDPVASADVSGNWTGSVTGAGSGTTNGAGVATITGKTRNNGSAEFCVTGIAGTGISFDGVTDCGSGG